MEFGELALFLIISLFLSWVAIFAWLGRFIKQKLEHDKLDKVWKRLDTEKEFDRWNPHK